jgi:hypothetical protein
MNKVVGMEGKGKRKGGQIKEWSNLYYKEFTSKHFTGEIWLLFLFCFFFFVMDEGAVVKL